MFTSGEAFDHAAWLEMMRKHLRRVHDLLGSDGSVWVHIDDNHSADCRVLLDQVFGRSNFVATVILRKPHGPNAPRHLSVDHDYLLIYAKDASAWRPNPLPRGDKPTPRYRNPDHDPRGPWTANIPYSPNFRQAFQYEVVGPDGTVVQPPAGRSWLYSKQRFEELDRDGRISWSNGRPRLKRYWSEATDKASPTVWDSADVGSRIEVERELRRLLLDDREHPVPRPERLLHHILMIATMPGDLVLDYFGGAGTTAAVAHKTGRRWISVHDNAFDLRPRLDKVIAGQDSGGITTEVNWSGGGSYEVMVAPPRHDEPEPLTRSLAEAIADGYVRNPVIASREDGPKDLRTRLADACQYLQECREAARAGEASPVLFVVCEKQSEVDEVVAVAY